MSTRTLPHGVTAYDSVDDWAHETGGRYERGPNGEIYATPAPHGFLDRVAQFAPYGIMAGMAYGGVANAFGLPGAMSAAGGATSAATAAAPAVNWAAAPSASSLFAPTGLVGTVAPAATTAASTAAGTGMSFGLGSLAKFFGSRGGEALVNTAGNLIGGRMQANAYTRSADIQAQAGREALAFEQEQYRRAQAEYDAWLHGGPIARLDELMASSRSSAPPAVNTTMPVPPSGAPTTLAQMRAVGSGQTAGAARATEPTVAMRSPTGAVKQIPAAMANDYLRRGGSFA